MSDASERFLDSTVESFADNPELQVHARCLLQDHVDPALANDASWDEAAIRLGRRNPGWLTKHRRTALSGISLAASIVCFVPNVLHLATIADLLDKALGYEFPAVFRLEETDQERFRKLGHGQSTDQQLILFGDVSKNSSSERMEALIRIHPNDPSYYANYAVCYLKDHHQLPDDFLAAAARIDPDNAWFPLFAASVSAENAVIPKRQSQAEQKAHAPRQWTVIDQTRLNESMALFQQGCRLPRFDSYRARRMKEQSDLLPHATNFEDDLREVVFVSEQLPSAPGWFHLAQAVAARAQSLADSRDLPSLQALLVNWRTFSSWQIRSCTTFLDIMLARFCIRFPLGDLQAAASRIGMEHDSKILAQVQLRWDADETQGKLRRRFRNVDPIVHHGGLLGATMPNLSSSVENPPVPDLDRLKPSRMVDQAIAHRIVAMLIALSLFGVGTLCALYRFRHGSLVRKVSARLARLFTLCDWGWIFGAGCLAPLLYALVLHHLTPLGGRDWGYPYTTFRLAGLQFLTWAMLTLTAPVLVARRQLRKRLPGLLPPARPKAGRIAFLLGVAALPVSGMGYLTGDPDYWLWIGTACLGLLTLWWLLLGARALFGRMPHALNRQIIARTMIPAYAFSVLLMVSLTFFYQAQERYWYPRDTYLGRSAESLGWSSYEYELTQIRKVEMLEIVRPLEELE